MWQLPFWKDKASATLEEFPAHMLLNVVLKDGSGS